MDHLEKAKHNIKLAMAMPDQEAACASSLVAIACTLVVIAESQQALIKRLDALIVPMADGDQALQTYTYAAGG